MTKLSKVLITGSRPVAPGRTGRGLAWRALPRPVHHAAGADDLAQEGVRAGAMVLAGGIADGC